MIDVEFRSSRLLMILRSHHAPDSGRLVGSVSHRETISAVFPDS